MNPPSSGPSDARGGLEVIAQETETRASERGDVQGFRVIGRLVGRRRGQRPQEVDLVAHQGEGDRGRQLAQGRRVDPARGVIDPQDAIGAPQLLACPADPLALDRIVARTDAGHVHQAQWQAVDLDVDLEQVAGGAWDRGDDGRVELTQCIEQAGFSRVGRTRDGDHHPGAYPLSPLRLHQDGPRLLDQVADLRGGDGGRVHIQLVVGEIEAGLETGAGVGQALDQGLDAPGESPLEATNRQAGPAGGGGLDEVGDRLGLGQIQLAVDEGALGELSRAGQSGTQSECSGQE